jgi:16S rRNA U1498 N3-methylase RsmE
VPVKLGQRILRTETAAIALLGILQYELGDLN